MPENKRQFKHLLAFVVSRVHECDNTSVILLFLEFFTTSSISYQVILSYMSALKYMFARFGWNSSTLEAPIIRRMLDGIKLSTHQVASPKSVFSLAEIREIARFCDFFP